MVKWENIWRTVMESSIVCINSDYHQSTWVCCVRKLWRSRLIMSKSSSNGPFLSDLWRPFSKKPWEKALFIYTRPSSSTCWTAYLIWILKMGTATIARQKMMKTLSIVTARRTRRRGWRITRHALRYPSARFKTSTATSRKKIFGKSWSWLLWINSSTT